MCTITLGEIFPNNGAIQWLLVRAPKESAYKPIIASETGYCTNSADQGIPDNVQGVYVPRLFFDQYLNGIKRSLEF